MKKVIPFIIGIVIGLSFGFGGGGFINSLLPEQAGKGEFFILYGLLFIALALSIVLHTIIHEAGHLIFGLISGYSFVSFRIFNIMLVKENGRLARKKFNIVGTGGQCLMSPPEPVNDTFPFILYNLGGSIFNFIASAVCLVFYFILPFGFGSAVLVVFVAIGVFLGILNIIPLNISGVPNDGHNALTLGKNGAARRAFWVQLRINALVTKGQRHRDIPAEWFDFIDNADLSDALVTAAAIFKYNHLMDKMELKEARILAEHLLNTAKKMIQIHKNELRCDLIYHELISECRKDEIERLYTKELKNYIKATSSYLSRQRLLYAYTVLFLNDKAEASKALDMFNKACSYYPIAGEIAGEKELMALVDKIADKNEHN